MCAGDGDALFQAHQLGQHLCTRHNRDTRFTCGDHFRVICLHGSGNDNRVCANDVGCLMAEQNLGTERAQALGCRTGLQVGTADTIAKVQQHFGDAAHTRATDADKVQMMNLVFHAASSSQIVATVCAASGLAKARAAMACCSNCSRG